MTKGQAVSPSFGRAARKDTSMDQRGPTGAGNPSQDPENGRAAGEGQGRQGKRYASSIDVARLAGVSQSAVSRTYRSGNVSEALRRRVLEAAAALNYQPSVIPRIMSTQRSNLVAVVVGGLYNPFYSAVLEACTVKLQESGHQVLLVHVESDHKLDSVIPQLASYRVDAVVSALAVHSAEAADQLATLRIPVISFNTWRHNEWVSPVSCDNAGAARVIAALFVARGARSFGYISGPVTSHASLDRRAGFEAEITERMGARVVVAEGDYHYDGGFKAALEMFSGAERPEALFCANDLLAFGAMDALRTRLGLGVPDDVLVAGFDDVPAAAWAAYDLTTFVHDGARMVDEALAILQRAENGETRAAEEVIVPARLVERGTTRAVSRAKGEAGL
jgi:DNA-binding LacI/PurR family transcriptional regulator